MNRPVRYAIEVIGGPDHGARLAVDTTARMIGRATNADLVLRDPSVSRRHVQVSATDEGVVIASCGDSPPFAVNGSPLRILRAKAGDRVILGSTTIVVTTADSPSGGASSGARTDVETLLTGASEDIRAIAAVHGLIEALDAAPDRAALDAALETWAIAHARALGVAVADEADPGGDPGKAVRTSAESADVTVISVPVPADIALRLVVRCALPEARVSDSHRRLLVVAGRVFGSSVTRLRRLEVATEEVASLRELSFGSARAFLGTSPAAKRIGALIGRLAASDVGVLIQGETGVGKTFVARLIHEAGARAGEPLRVLNCAAIPESLAEAELFGHERGAFTGAVAPRAGAFESAGGGTLVLDEIGELSLAVQSKLLRVLEERRFERVGSNRALDVRARIICATNRNLETLVAGKTFRSDLFFRISVVRIEVPPLRERGEDLVLLAQQILSDASRSAGRRITGFSAAALEAIRRYSWPGNVRELRNAIDHAVALGDGAVVVPADLPIGAAGPAVQPEDLDLLRLPIDMASAEQRIIEAALRHCGGNRVKAAALLGIGRQTLYNKLGDAARRQPGS